ncbi:MAG TPA: hypothetical protein VK674_05285 [Candidatus Limnocylindria bacterium]|nr:hypothetical protein [Candidatus Limnocylindria bacterium]
MLTIIDNPNAPTAYDYKISVPNGGKIQLNSNGGALVLNRKNKPVAVVATPWAKDATGKAVQTHFTTDGQTLTQYVQHNVPGVVYPVTADPKFRWSWWGVTIYFSRGESNFIAGAGSAALGTLGVAGAVAGFSIQQAAQKVISKGYCLAIYRSWAVIQTWWYHKC